MSARPQRQLTGLIDCNNFFVSCERLFRPDLRTRPVVVLSSNDGCVISRSKEAKALGIPMGIPYFEVERLLKKERVAVFSSNFQLYRDLSSRVMAVIADTVDSYEVYSIDEAFFDIPLRIDAVEFASMLRTRIMRDVGIPVSIGIAPTQTLAKLAGSEAKTSPQGVVSVVPGPSIEAVSLKELWGVGRATAERLQRDGIVTVGDAVARGAGALRNLLGINGERLYFELIGTSASLPHTSVGATTTSSRSFGRPTGDCAVVEDALTYHTAHLAEKLRTRSALAKHALLYLSWKEEGTRASMTTPVPLSHATSDTRILTVQVLKAFRATHDGGRKYRKVGVTLSTIDETNMTTGQLFQTEAPGPRESPLLMKALDHINARYGRDSLRIATHQTQPLWASKTQFVSQPYTTSWDTLPRVRNDL